MDINVYLDKLMDFYKVSNFTELAHKLNIQPQNISKWRQRNSINAIKKKCRELGIYQEIFGDINTTTFTQTGDNSQQINKQEDILNKQNMSLISDLELVMTKNELNLELNQYLKNLLIDKIVSKFRQEKTILYKILEFIKLEYEEQVRPFLFLYYIFRFIIQDPRRKDIYSYKEYLIDVIQSFNTKSLANGPIFTKKIVNDFTESIELKLSEDECRILIENAKSVLENLESRMPLKLLRFHRSINLKSLFPGKF